MDIIDVKNKVYEMVSASTVDTLIIDIKLIDNIFERLISFGYEPKGNDIFTIGFIIIKVDNNVKNICNISTIPTELFTNIVDMCVGEILYNFLSCGKLEDIFDLNEVKTLNIGDTSVTFDNSISITQQINNLIDNLLHSAERGLLCYRKLRW